MAVKQLDDLSSIKVVHVLPRLKISSGIPPAVFGIANAAHSVGVEAEIYAAYEDRGFSLASDVPYKTSTPNCFGRLFGLTLEEINHLRRRRSNGWLCHLHGLWSGATFAELLSKTDHQNSPVIVSPHGMLSKPALSISPIRKQAAWNLWQKAQLNSSAVVHVTSEAELTEVRLAGVTASICQIPLSVNFAPSAPRTRRIDDLLTIGFLGRLAPIKQLEVLLEAYCLLNESYKDSRLLIAGPTQDSRYVDFLKRSYPPRLDIQWLGEVAGQHKNEFFEKIDLLILPSASENFGLVVVEALANMVPVAASSGTPWASLESNGLGFYGFNDVGSLLKVLQQARAMGPAGLAALGSGGPAYVSRNFGIESVGTKWKEVYRWVLGIQDRPNHVTSA